MVGGGPGRVAELEAGHGADADQATLDPVGPLGGVVSAVESGERGLVDQPPGHDHADDITSGIVEVGGELGETTEIVDRDGTCGRRPLAVERSSKVCAARQPESSGLGVDGSQHVVGHVSDQDIGHG